MATIKFWSEMTKATTVDGEDKVMIGRNATGEAMYADFQYLINQAGMNSSDYIPVDGNTLPDGGEGNKVTFAGPGTYTQSGGDDVVVPENSLGIIVWDGDEWVLGSVISVPGAPSDEVVEGGQMPVSQDAVWEFFRSENLNKGKSFPFLNQPSGPKVDKVNDLILNTYIEERSTSLNFEFTISLIAKNREAGDWGNAIVFTRLDKDTLEHAGNVSFRSTSEDLPQYVISELNKLELGGLQCISIYVESFSRVFHILIDTDKISDGELLDLSYSDHSENKMFFSSSVYNLSGLIYRDTIQFMNNLDRFVLNKGKDYPFVNYPNSQESKVSLLKNAILDMKLHYTDERHDYTFYIGAFYKNDPEWGNGIMLMRRRKGVGAIGGLRLTSKVPDDRDLTVDSYTVDILDSWDDGGVIYTDIKPTNDSFGFSFLTIAIDVDELQDGTTLIGYQDNQTWGEMDLNPISYIESTSPVETEKEIKKYTTFREALTAEASGLLICGNILSKSKEDYVDSGGSFKPSLIYDQYEAVSKDCPGRLKKQSQIMTFMLPDESTARVMSFGSRFIYFSDYTDIYRTQDELKFDELNVDNTDFERIKLPENLPDSSRVTEGGVRGVYELDNGELLIECRNGIMEDPEDDYRGRRTQLYLTQNLKDIPSNIVDGVKEIDLTGSVVKVNEYKAFTATRGKVGTTVSIEGNIIALSPYHTGKVGLVHLSTDYGKTWKIIFNMGVEDPEFSVPYKGSPGAWPRPQDLTPPMPSNMWEEGGNDNYHVHGVYIDRHYNNRIWVATGDAGSNAEGRSAVWFTDDEGQSWTRIQTKGTEKYDAPFGIQPMGFIGTKDYLLISSDSSVDGLYRHNRLNKEAPEIEAAYWYKDTFSNTLRVLGAGGVVTEEGYVYYLFHPNTPTSYEEGVVVFTPDGLNFKEVYFDEISDGTSNSDRNINWGSWMGTDRFGNIYIANNNDTIIKLI